MARADHVVGRKEVVEERQSGSIRGGTASGRGGRCRVEREVLGSRERRLANDGLKLGQRAGPIGLQLLASWSLSKNSTVHPQHCQRPHGTGRRGFDWRCLAQTMNDNMQVTETRKATSMHEHVGCDPNSYAGVS